MIEVGDTLFLDHEEYKVVQVSPGRGVGIIKPIERSGPFTERTLAVGRLEALRDCTHEDQTYRMTTVGPEWFCGECGMDTEVDLPIED